MKVTYMVTVNTGDVDVEDVDDYLSSLIEVWNVRTVRITPVPAKMAKLVRKLLGF